MYRVFIKNCVFSQFTAIHPLHVREQLIWNKIWMYSHSYWLAIFCTTNSSPVQAEERSQNIENSWKKQYLMNTLYNVTGEGDREGVGEGDNMRGWELVKMKSRSLEILWEADDESTFGLSKPFHSTTNWVKFKDNPILSLLNSCSSVGWSVGPS